MIKLSRFCLGLIYNGIKFTSQRNMATIPVVDFSSYGLEVTDTDAVSLQSQQKLSRQIYDAFSTVGFVYLRNHGISQEKIDDAFRLSKTFFDLPKEKKEWYNMPDNVNVHGYVGVAGESVNPDRPGDLKEMYNVTPGLSKKWPNSELPTFQNDMEAFFDTCQQLAFRLLDIIALSLAIKDRNYFIRCHQKTKTEANTTTLRLLHYPPLPENNNIEAGQIRLGEHSDYGTMTLLFQDTVGGLEVRRRDGEYIPAVPIPGTILINISDTLQKWTADQLVSTVHRVLIPEEDLRRRRSRQSIAFFVNPDTDTIIKCFDGSHKYPPMYHKQFLKHRFDITYNK